MKQVSFLTITSAVALYATTLGAQQLPAPASPPVAAQEKPTLSERAGKLVDKVSGMPSGEADIDMRRVLGSLAGLAPKPIDQLTAAEARKQPGPADAVKALLQKEGKDPAAVSAALNVKTEDMTYESAGTTLPIRVYSPQDGARNGKPLPVVVYFHGGGWVIANMDAYDATPRSMANQANAIFVSVEYRFAPENKFPAAHDDAIAAYKWVLANAEKFGGDPKRVAVMGESAGGNLAINVSIAARDQNLQRPMYQVLVYPVAGVDMMTASYTSNAYARPLNKVMMGWFVKNVIKTDADLQDPRIDLIGKANLKDLPSTTVITAEIDPLMTDGKLLADKLTSSGVRVQYVNFDGVTHEFFGMAAAVAKAASAQTVVAQQLQAALTDGSREALR